VSVFLMLGVVEALLREEVPLDESAPASGTRNMHPSCSPVTCILTAPRLTKVGPTCSRPTGSSFMDVRLSW
jgi:hypothetical protein